MPRDISRDLAELETTRLTGDLRPSSPRSLLVAGLVIAGHPDLRRVGQQAPLTALESGRAVGLSRLEPTFSSPSGDARARSLNDPHLSRQPLRLVPGPEPGSLRLVLAGSRTRVAVNGEVQACDRDFTAEEVEQGIVLTLGGRVVLLLQPVDPLPSDLPDFGLVGESVAVRELRREVRAAAPLSTPALLLGETGTGKELVARALHRHGPRRDGPFVAVNMAALSPALAPAELFGAVRGAYTGADGKRAGLFQSADGGTLFLDEIGACTPEVQAMLLRALERGEVQPVGSAKSWRVDVRVVAATDADLERGIRDGDFRAPLLHRLAGYEIRLPPLRHRRDDIGRLLLHFLAEELGASDLAGSAGYRLPSLPTELFALLVATQWSGNVRQLRNVARRLALAVREGRPAEELLPSVASLLAEPAGSRPARPAVSGHASQRSPRAPGTASRLFRRAEDVDSAELLAALRENAWKLRTTAKQLRVSRPTLYRLIEARDGIRKASELSRAEIEAALVATDRDVKRAALNLEVSPQGLKRRLTEIGRS